MSFDKEKNKLVKELEKTLTSLKKNLEQIKNTNSFEELLLVMESQGRGLNKKE